MSANPKLTRAPLVESLFEIRFVPTMDYSFFLGALSNHLASDIQKSETLIPDQIPDFPGQPLIRQRIELKNDQGVVQIGRGILSVNRLKYDRFENFMTLIDKVLKILSELEKSSTVKRLGLRYINKIPMDKEWKDILTVIVVTPQQIQSGMDSVYYKFVVNKGTDGFMQITLANPVNQQSNLKEVVIDLDHYKEVESKFNPAEIQSWIKTAHQTVYDTFIGCLNPNFKREIE